MDLFSGIGGFALAARWNGLRTVQFVEIDPFCRRVLAKHWPGVPIHDDIKTYHHVVKNTIGCGRSHGEHGEEKSAVRRQRISGAGNGDGVYLLTGGFPCQPYSVAGKRRGAADDRALWPEMLRVIKEAKPRWVLGENVAGFVGMGLDQSIADLEGEGYAVQAFIVPACAVNAPHRRDRCWIVAHSEQAGAGSFCGEIANEERGSGQGWRESLRQTHGETCAMRIAAADRHAADAEHKRCIGRGGRCDCDCNRIQESEQSGGKSRGAASRCDRWEQNWPEVATRLCRVDDGLPRVVDRVARLRALGNAIVPQVAAEIIRCIVEADKQQPGDFK